MFDPTFGSSVFDTRACSLVRIDSFPARWQDGRVFIDAPDLHGYAEELPGETDSILFYATYKKDSHRQGADVWDLIRLTSPEERKG